MYKTFNVSIPLENIPSDVLVWEYAEDFADKSQDNVEVAELTGRWKDNKTGKAIGEGGSEIEFVVEGYVSGPVWPPVRSQQSSLIRLFCAFALECKSQIRCCP